MNSNSGLFNLQGSILNLCDHPVSLKTKNGQNLSQFPRQGRLNLDINLADVFTDKDMTPIRHLNQLIPLYAPTNEKITLSEIAEAPYLGEVPNSQKYGPAIFYIVPRPFLCYALRYHWNFTSRLLVLEREPEPEPPESGIKIYSPKSERNRRPTGRLVSAMDYKVPPEFRYWLQDRDLTLISSRGDG